MFGVWWRLCEQCGWSRNMAKKAMLSQVVKEVKPWA